MKHEAFFRILDTANVAVLFIHGIVGTPNHFRDFVELVPKDISVANILLDGHGKGVDDFSKTSMKKWKAQVNDAVEMLLTKHDKIVIVAHSMGTLFAIQQAISKPNKIAALFLLAAPLRLFLKPSMAKNTSKVFFDKIPETDQKAMAAKEAYGIENDRRLWKYVGWIPRYLELFREIKSVCEQLDRLHTPCDCYQSKNDEMVSLNTLKLLKENHSIRISVLEGSAHYYYSQKDHDFLLEEFHKFLARYCV